MEALPVGCVHPRTLQPHYAFILTEWGPIHAHVLPFLFSLAIPGHTYLQYRVASPINLVIKRNSAPYRM